MTNFDIIEDTHLLAGTEPPLSTPEEVDADVEAAKGVIGEMRQGIFTQDSSPAIEGRPVLVTTRGCGIFFGYTTDINSFSISLNHARSYVNGHCFGGFTDLATKGPSAGAQIGARLSKVYLREVTSIIDVEPAAVEVWESTPAAEVIVLQLNASRSEIVWPESGGAA